MGCLIGFLLPALLLFTGCPEGFLAPPLFTGCPEGFLAPPLFMGCPEGFLAPPLLTDCPECFLAPPFGTDGADETGFPRSSEGLTSRRSA